MGSVIMKLLTSTLVTLTLVLASVYCQENNENDIKKAEKRTLDLSFLGIDLSQIFDRLLSPTGIVNQFAISISLQLFQSVGYVITGILYAILTASTDGALREAITFFDFLLSPQAIATTILRRGLLVVWELIARSVTVFGLFGVFETISQILATTTIDSVWTFLSSAQTYKLFTWRFIVGTTYLLAGFVVYNLLGMDPAGL